MLGILSGSVVLAFNTTCPIWQYYDNDSHRCECGFELFCRGQNVVEIKEGYCAISAGYEDHYYIGQCPFMHTVNNTNRLFSEMPGDPDVLDNVMCDPYNRKGLLCGECFEGFGPALYSVDMKCANCSEGSPAFGIFLYTFLELVPLTVFFICMLFFHFSITSGPMLGYLLFCQAVTYTVDNTYITKYISTHVSSSFLYLLIPCRFWTMHWIFKSVIPSFCISKELTGIHIKMLAFVPVTYPVVLVVITFILFELHAKNCRIIHALWKPFRNIKAVTSEAVIHAFASFIFLSQISVLNTFLTLCTRIVTYKQDGILYKSTVFGDPLVEWLNKEHITWTLVAAVPLTFLTIVPSAILTLYTSRTYRCISRSLSARKRLAITAFAEALNRCFKDGLNGTRDYRALAGLMPAFIVIYGVFMDVLLFTGYVEDQDIITAVVMMMVALLVSYARPCKATVSNASLSFHCFLFGIMAIGSHLWNIELNEVSTGALEWLFILVILTSHVVVYLWIGYRATLSVKVHLCRIVLLVKEKTIDLCKNHGSYQELS